MTPQQIEAATAIGWPAQFETNIAGWRVFAGLGPVGRVNSCWPLAFDGGDVEGAIDEVEHFYQARNLSPQFKVALGIAEPNDLYARLSHRGYQTHSHVAVMTCARALPAPNHTVVIKPTVTPEMLEVIRATSPTALDGQERCDILARIPNPSAFGTVYIEDQAVAVGLATFTGESAGIAAMRTKTAFRQRGLARSILRAVSAQAFDNGAQMLWLQVETNNEPAIRLYESEGFGVDYHYETLRRMPR